MVSLIMAILWKIAATASIVYGLAWLLHSGGVVHDKYTTPVGGVSIFVIITCVVINLLLCIWVLK